MRTKVGTAYSVRLGPSRMQYKSGVFLDNHKDAWVYTTISPTISRWPLSHGFTYSAEESHKTDSHPLYITGHGGAGDTLVRVALSVTSHPAVATHHA